MAQEQVNVQLNLISNAEQAVQALQSQLDQLKSKSVEIPIKFKTSADGAGDVRKTLQSGLESARATETSLKLQENTLQRQLNQYQSINNSAKAILAQGRGGAKALQEQLRNVDKARQGYKSTETSLNAIKARIQAAEKQTKLWSDRIKGLGQETKALDKGGGFFDGLLGKLTLGGIAVEAFKQALSGLGEFVAQGVAFEQLQLSLEAFAGGTEEAAQAYQAFKNTALKTPFSLAGVAQAGKTLLAFDVGLEDAINSTDQLAIVAGATGSDLNNLARNLGQISAQGRAYTRDLNQFATAGIPIYTQLATTLGVSVQQVRKFAEEGSIGFEEVQAALTSLTAAGTAFSDLANRQLNTVAGQIGNVQTAIQELAGEAIKQFGPFIVASLKLLKSAVDLVSRDFDKFAIVIGVVSGSALIGKLLPAFQKVIGVIQVFNNALKAQAAIQGLNALAEATKGMSIQAQFAVQQQQALAAAQIASAQAAKALIVSYVKLGVVIAATAAALVLLKTTADAYKPVEAIKQDIDSAERFDESLDQVRASLQGIKQEASNVAPAFESLEAAINNTSKTWLLGLVGVYQYNLQLRNAEANIIGFAKATNQQGQANLKLVRTNQEYLNSVTKTAQGTKNLIALSRSRKKALEEENEGFKGQIEALQQLKPRNEDERTAQTLSIALLRTRVSENEVYINSLNKQLGSLEALTTAQSQLDQLLANPTLENRNASLEVYSSTIDATIKAVNTLISAQKTLAESNLKNLEDSLRNITFQYDLQIGKLREQKTTLDSILNASKLLEELETRKQIGTSGRKEVLELDREILKQRIAQGAVELQGLQFGSLEYNQAKRQLKLDEFALISLDNQLKNFEQKDALQTQALETATQIAVAEADSAVASQDVRDAIAEETVVLGVVLGQLDAKQRKFAEIKAEVDTLITIMETGFNKQLSDAETATGNILSDLQRISQITFPNLPKSGLPTNFAGGPMRGGERSHVNELGKEAFLGASGRLSMINAPAWGVWRAPESGTVIPAHLTKQLNIPAGGINLNNPRVANANRRVSTVGGGSTRINGALNQLSAAQHSQAQQLGKLSRAIDAMRDKDWKVDVNINGNNPLLDRLRRR